MHTILPEEEFEDTKRIIRIRKSKKEKQHYVRCVLDPRSSSFEVGSHLEINFTLA
jgi:hypothetical protein